MQRRALITGAGGFVGSHLTRRLLADGWQVHVIIRKSTDSGVLRALRNDLMMHVHDGSTAGMQAIVEAAKPEVVFHLASLFLSEHEAKDIENLVRSNLLFGTQLAESLVQAGTHRMVNTGTAWQHYGDGDYSPVNLYAATKQAFEDLLQYYVEAKALRVITLKLCDTYGPDDPRPKLMNLLKARAADHRPLAMSGGEQLVDLVHVEDVVRAFVTAGELLLSGGIEGHSRFSVTSGDPVRLRDLVNQHVERALGRKLDIAWGARPYRAREVMKPWSGEPVPGWMPRIKLAEGLEDIFPPAGPARH